MSYLFANDGHLQCTLGAGIATSAGVSAFFWVQKSDWSTNADTFFNIGQTDSSQDYSLYVWNAATLDTIRVATDNPGLDVSTLTFSVANEADGIWVPVMAVWDGDSSRQVHALYPRQSSTADTSTSALSSLDVIRWGRSLTASNGVNGYMAELCVWNRALTTADFGTLVTAAGTGKYPGELYPGDVVGYWSLETDDLTDGSGNGNTLTLTGTSAYSATHPTVSAIVAPQFFQYQSRLNPLLRM